MSLVRDAPKIMFGSRPSSGKTRVSSQDLSGLEVAPVTYTFKARRVCGQPPRFRFLSRKKTVHS